MNLVEMNKAIMSKKRNEVVIKNQITQGDILLFYDMLNISKNIQTLFDSIDDSNTFFKIYPDFKKVLTNGKAVECFYAVKKGNIWEGVPMRLVYILTKAFESNGKELVNVTLNTATGLLAPYASDTYVYNDSKLTIKDIIDNVVGKSSKLLTASNPIVKYKDCVEVFIPNANRVAVLPNDMVEYVTVDNCNTLQWDKTNGVTVEGVPLRTLNNRLGITRNDFDLRECI